MTPDGIPLPELGRLPIDDRVVLPASRVRFAAVTLCRLACLQPGAARAEAVHDDACLMPLLLARDLEAAAWTAAGQVSGDCQDPVKHSACPGCACECHRPS